MKNKKKIRPVKNQDDCTPILLPYLMKAKLIKLNKDTISEKIDAISMNDED